MAKFIPSNEKSPAWFLKNLKMINVSPRFFAIAKTNVFEEVSPFVKRLIRYLGNKWQMSKAGNQKILKPKEIFPELKEKCKVSTK